jgi:DNA polymerase III alpha subunit (gram-positive type)
MPMHKTKFDLEIFDLNFINAELERHKMPLISNKTVDTLNLARWAYPILGKYSLQFLAQKFQINVENAHRADDDARVCMDFFIKCVSGEKPKF